MIIFNVHRLRFLYDSQSFLNRSLLVKEAFCLGKTADIPLSFSLYRAVKLVPHGQLCIFTYIIPLFMPKLICRATIVIHNNHRLPLDFCPAIVTLVRNFYILYSLFCLPFELFLCSSWFSKQSIHVDACKIRKR